MIQGELLDERTSCQSLLVLGSGRSADVSQLVEVDSPSQTPLLAISFSPQASPRPDYWEQHIGFRPADVVLITTESGADQSADDGSVSYVTAPSALTGIGMQATEQLASWDDESDLRPLVVVDSLTILLQYVSVKSLYRFLHALTVRLDASNARGVFYLDPMTQDDQTVYTFASLFDAIAEPDDSDDSDDSDERTNGHASSAWSVRTR
ncbi:hypothetical protein ACFQJC_15320 [Haloferax namakaokahaiae]|uniref:Recombinase RecA n=1 Tax=Haloferax namakaokahaiae TaxID=1748331 RepID=A0ABD5ZHY0_9EURY